MQAGLYGNQHGWKLADWKTMATSCGVRLLIVDEPSPHQAGVYSADVTARATFRTRDYQQKGAIASKISGLV